MICSLMMETSTSSVDSRRDEFIGMFLCSLCYGVSVTLSENESYVSSFFHAFVCLASWFFGFRCFWGNVGNEL